jgi:hypothetical protein
MQPAITDLFSSIRGFFVGLRHLLVQSVPSIFATLLFRPLPRQLFSFIVFKTAAVNYSKYFYALRPLMQPAAMDLFSSLSGFFVG